MTQLEKLPGHEAQNHGHETTDISMGAISATGDNSEAQKPQSLPLHSSSLRSNRPRSSEDYNNPDAYRNLDDAFDEPPIQDASEAAIQRHTSREKQFAQNRGAGTEAVEAQQRPTSRVSPNRRSSLRQRRQSFPGNSYDIPEQYVHAAEVSSTCPVENPDESPYYEHRALEDSRSRDQEYLQDQAQARKSDTRNEHTDAPPLTDSGDGKDKEAQFSKLATQLYTISYLILFSFFGTLARLGLQAITSYHGAPVIFSSVWPNFAGSLVMGFLSEDRMLFRHEWGTPTYDQQLEKARHRKADEESGGSSSRTSDVDLAAAKKAHLATKKTIPLYIGLATGFCGSFTSFSSFIRDVFLALSNDLPSPDLGGSTLPRNGGYSFEALLAVILTTVSLSLAGLFVGAHIAIALERFTPTLPFTFTRKIVDRVAVVLAIGCWVGAIVLSAVPPDRFEHGLGSAETWRGRATFALVFAPLGCLARFYASLYLNGKIASFPLGTFAVNIFGTAILAMAWDIAHVPDGGVIGCQLLQGIEDGFCGCLTTVSTWVSELAALRRRNAYVYGVASVVTALACMVAIMGGLRWSQGFAGLVCLH